MKIKFDQNRDPAPLNCGTYFKVLCLLKENISATILQNQENYGGWGLVLYSTR